jgi:hypothetical protein
MNPKNFITHIKHLKVNTYPNNSEIKQIYIYQQINELLFIILPPRNRKQLLFTKTKISMQSLSPLMIFSLRVSRTQGTKIV